MTQAIEEKQLPAIITLKPVMEPEEVQVSEVEILQFVRDCLDEGPPDKGDFGKFPGTNRDCLFQSGAQKLCNYFGLRPDFGTEDWCKIADYDRQIGGVPAPLFKYAGTCRIVRIQDSVEIGQKIGLCTSYESKYLYREGVKTCPECGKATLRKSKIEWGGGWYCNQKDGGCGGQWKGEAEWTDTRSGEIKFASEEDLETCAGIDAQPTGRTVNPNLFDIENTVLQMAQKRAFVSATIMALRAANIFTMGIEDEPGRHISENSDKKPTGPICSPKQRQDLIEEARESWGWDQKEVVKYIARTFFSDFRGTKDGLAKHIENNFTTHMLDQVFIHVRHYRADGSEHPAQTKNNPQPDEIDQNLDVLFAGEEGEEPNE